MDPSDQNSQWDHQLVDPDSDFIIYPAEGTTTWHPNSQPVSAATNGMMHALLTQFMTLNGAPPLLRPFMSHFNSIIASPGLVVPPAGSWEEPVEPSAVWSFNVSGPSTTTEPPPSAQVSIELTPSAQVSIEPSPAAQMFVPVLNALLIQNPFDDELAVQRFESMAMSMCPLLDAAKISYSVRQLQRGSTRGGG